MNQNSSDPPPEKNDTVHEQRNPAEGSNPGEDISPATVVVPPRPQRPQPPPDKDEARERRTERRDRIRLGVEILAVIVGLIGIGGLFVTFQETQETNRIARRTLEVQERPWVPADVALTRPFSTNDEVGIEVTVKNVGHSVAIDVGVRAEIIYDPLFSAIEKRTITFPLPDPSEIDMHREILCGEMFRGTEKSIEYGQSPLVLFPDQGGTIQAMARGYSGEAKERATRWKFDYEGITEPFEEPLGDNMFVSPVLVGCVTYSSAFTERRYATEFTRVVSSINHPDGHVPVGVSVPVENIRLKPYRSNGEKYARKYID